MIKRKIILKLENPPHRSSNDSCIKKSVKNKNCHPPCKIQRSERSTWSRRSTYFLLLILISFFNRETREIRTSFFVRRIAQGGMQFWRRFPMNWGACTTQEFSLRGRCSSNGYPSPGGEERKSRNHRPIQSTVNACLLPPLTTILTSSRAATASNGHRVSSISRREMAAFVQFFCFFFFPSFNCFFFSFVNLQY